MKLGIDDTELQAAYEELSGSKEVAELAPELREAALNLFDLGPEFISFESRSTSGAIEIVFKPGKGLLDLLAALRAGDLHGHLAKLAHNESSQFSCSEKDITEQAIGKHRRHAAHAMGIKAQD